jgi:hypothetical protein
MRAFQLLEPKVASSQVLLPDSLTYVSADCQAPTSGHLEPRGGTVGEVVGAPALPAEATAGAAGKGGSPPPTPAWTGFPPGWILLQQRGITASQV